MKVENFKIFLTVARTENMHKTAEIFFTSYQNISFIIKNMERDLGFALFTRNNKGMCLTQEGKEFLNIIEPFVYEYEEFLMQKATHEDMPIYHVYTTEVMARYVRSLEDMLYSDYYYCSLKSKTLSAMLQMLENNQSGIYLIPSNNIISPNVMTQKEGIILARDKNIIVCHVSNAVASQVPLSMEQKKNLLTVFSGNYAQQLGRMKALNIDDIELCKKYMREKGFCYSTTRFIFEHDFMDLDEWIVLEENEKIEIKYNLIFNLPKHQLDLARLFFLPPLQNMFSYK